MAYADNPHKNGRPLRDGDAPTIPISFRLTDAELARLDKRRKKAPRSIAIRDALAAAGLI